jgi:uncharacterized membrane protein
MAKWKSRILLGIITVPIWITPFVLKWLIIIVGQGCQWIYDFVTKGETDKWKWSI